MEKMKIQLLGVGRIGFSEETVFRDRLKANRFGDKRTDWDKEFHRIGEALEKSWRLAWEEVMRELESRSY